MNFKTIGFFKHSVAWFASAILLSTALQAAKSITYFGVTWNFAEDHPTGVFANGEPWVVGPVSLISVTPNNNVVWDESYPGEPGPNSGSMRVTTPNTLQGFCTKMKAIRGYPNDKVYTRSLDLSLTENLPVILKAGEMLMSAVGQTESEGGVGRSVTNEICVLTVSADAPQSGSFRPSLFSTNPREVRYNKSDINYSILKNLAPVPATPSTEDIESRLPALPWFEFDNTWVQTQYGPANNFAADGGPTYPNASSVYGRNIAYKWSYVALWLNTANSQAVKEKAMVQTIQAGLDIASFLQHGGAFNSDGGHKIGRKFPMLLAGLALNDSEILALAADQVTPRFSEDQSTFFVLQKDVGRAVNGGIDAQYTQVDVGLPDWGVKHFNDPRNDDRRWEGGVPYRYVTWPGMAGAVLAVALMEKQGAWNHPAAFAYNERFYKQNRGLGDGFEGQMWIRHKKSDDGSPSAPQGLKIKR